MQLNRATISKTHLVFFLASAVMLTFFLIKVLISVQVIKHDSNIDTLEYLLFFIFAIPFSIIIKEAFQKRKLEVSKANYVKQLNSTLLEQSHSELFYTGNISEVERVLTQKMAEALKVDRVSIWLYDSTRSKIVCHQLFIREEDQDKFYQGTELFEKDFKPYFKTLKLEPLIAADDAEAHSATSCLRDVYLRPLGIKSMLDVPIWYRGTLIGVICIESLIRRSWSKEEIDFSQLLSSFYSFAYSMKETNDLLRKIKENEKFVDTASLISMTDSRGKITYVNEKFSKISGWELKEAIGKDHSIVNSGLQPDGYWGKMYDAVLKGKIWNDVVVNKAKDGSLYYVDTYIRARFDEKGNLEGFSSIRQDVTKIFESLNEIDKKNTYLEHAAKILRHDMHSGINTYIPRGVSSLERRLSEEDIKRLKIEAPLRMIKEGLKHTQKVYRGVYEFTNLVKKDACLEKTQCNVKSILNEYLSSTSYKSQVVLDDSLPDLEVNESLFCTAIDNLIRNGLKYNDSDTKIVKLYSSAGDIFIEDNGRGLDQEEFERLCKPYMRKEGQRESGSGLGLNICTAILKEHGFEITAEKLQQGTRLKIKIK